MSIKRAVAIPLMREAVDKKQSRSSFLRELKLKGLSYRKTDMLADWRNIANIDAKKDLFKFVRKTYKPSQAVVAKTNWEFKERYTSFVKVLSQITPDEPLVESFVAVRYDDLVSPEEVERLAWEMIQEQSPKKIQQVVGLTAFSVYENAWL